MSHNLTRPEIEAALAAPYTHTNGCWGSDPQNL
jgi:hypothetical protein